MNREQSGPITLTGGTTSITHEQHQQMIAVAAYYRAERRAFRDGDPVADWLEAETDINRVLKQSPVSIERA